MDFAPLEKVDAALGVAWHERRCRFPRIVCLPETFPLRFELVPPRYIRGRAVPHDPRRVVLMLLREPVVLAHLRVGAMELDVVASGVGKTRPHLGVMPISEQVLPDVEGICILAESLQDLGREVVRGLAVLTEFGGALQPRGIADAGLGDRRLLLVVATLLVVLHERLGDLRRHLLPFGHKVLTVTGLPRGRPRLTLRDAIPPE